jgi:hypothetical protein
MKQLSLVILKFLKKKDFNIFLYDQLVELAYSVLREGHATLTLLAATLHLSG